MEKEIRLSYYEYNKTLKELEDAKEELFNLKNNGVYFGYTTRKIIDNGIDCFGRYSEFITDKQYQFTNESDAILNIKSEIELLNNEIFTQNNKIDKTEKELFDKTKNEQRIMNLIYLVSKDVWDFEEFANMNKLQKIFYILFKTK